MAWIVILKKETEDKGFPPGYFPRRFHHKKDAKAFIEEIRGRGGKAELRNSLQKK